MTKTFVSAISLCDIFAERLRDMYPLSAVQGMNVFALGDGEWMPSKLREPITVGMLADANAIIVRMRAEFLLET